MRVKKFHFDVLDESVASEIEKIQAKFGLTNLACSENFTGVHKEKDVKLKNIENESSKRYELLDFALADVFRMLMRKKFDKNERKKWLAKNLAKLLFKNVIFYLLFLPIIFSILIKSLCP